MRHISINRSVLKLAVISVCTIFLFAHFAACRLKRPEKVSDNDVKTPPAAILKGKYMRVEVKRKPFGLKITGASGETLLESAGPLSFTTVTRQRTKERVAWYSISKGKAERWTEVDKIVSVDEKADRVDINLGTEPDGPPLVRLSIFFINERSLRIESEVIDRPEVNRLVFKFQSDTDDTYFGMGERFYSPEHSGQRIRVWSEEGSMGIYNLSKIFPNLSFNPFPMGRDSTYYPMPFFLNLRGYGFLLDDTHYSLFDFGKSDSDVLEITNWNNRFDFIVFYGPDPLKVIEEMTALTGRITVPTPWVFAPWNVSITGSDRVREVAATVRKEKIPTSAIWSEDWWWDQTTPKLPRNKEWDLNRVDYPDYEKMISELHNDGFRYLGYFQPYIFVDSELYAEGAAKGYFTMNEDGTPAIINVTFAKKAQIDLTNPDAVRWWQDKFFKKCVDWGVDGWMTDYSEYTPPYSKSYDGRDGWELHNEYPVLWAKITREFFDRARPDGDYAFFVRAGYTGTPKYASVVWTGDSNANWEKYDGMPSVISAVTSVGISGFPVTATDIAGMHCVLSQSTDKELFIRWTELGAMLPVMRNHRGNDFCNNWKFDDDRETLEAYKKYAVLHTALFPYFYTLVNEASTKGWPVTRHLALHYRDDPGSASEHYEFLLGDRMLVAPVIVDKAREREVYFPPGDWLDFWTGERYTGPGRVVVPAPLEHLPLFVKSGSIVPMFNSQIDTLVKEDREDLNGWDDANKSMKIVFFGEGEDVFDLWDKTSISCRREIGGYEKCHVVDTLERKYTFEFR